MDGASKFVRGDAIADLLAVLVTSPNIRPFVRAIVERFRAQTACRPQSEIHPRVRLKTVGSI